MSRALSAILRHTAPRLGVHLDPEGYAETGALLRAGPLRNLGATADGLRRLVAEDNKQRFDLVQWHGTSYIAAVQGHSIPIERPLGRLLTAADSPRMGFHATTRRAWDSIRSLGLLPGRDTGGTRAEVHLLGDDQSPEAQRRAFRSTADIVVRIQLQRLIQDGGRVRCSPNQVLLTSAIAPAYLDGFSTMAVHFRSLDSSRQGR